MNLNIRTRSGAEYSVPLQKEFEKLNAEEAMTKIYDLIIPGNHSMFFMYNHTFFVKYIEAMWVE